MSHATVTARPRRGRAETGIQTVIMLAVAATAGAASFTHVHDWTMHNSPAGTSDWFGWANAMVTELIPIAAGLEVRRRRRKGLPVTWYPIALILGTVALSLTGQFAEAKPGPSGWLISAVPALGFLALVKLVLSRPATPAPAAPAAVAEPHPEIDGRTQPDFDGKTGDAKPSATVTRTVPKSEVTRALIEEIAGKMPTATPVEIAAEAGVSETTARRYLPAKHPAVAAKPPARINGARPELTPV